MGGGSTCGLAPGVSLLEERHVGVDDLIIELAVWKEALNFGFGDSDVEVGG